MQNALVTSGIVCLVAAVVGGGLKAFGMEIPALNSLRRQVILAGLGAALLAIGLSLNPSNASAVDESAPIDDRPVAPEPNAPEPNPQRAEVPSQEVCTLAKAARLSQDGVNKLHVFEALAQADYPGIDEDTAATRELLCRPLLDEGYT